MACSSDSPRQALQLAERGDASKADILALSPVACDPEHV